MAAALLALHAALAAHPESAWDERVDPACCPYPEHDPRDYNWLGLGLGFGLDLSG